jgi:hypothetical protein
MVKTVVSGLQQQIEDVRREAFAAGYSAAMQAIQNVASRLPFKLGTTAAAPRRSGQGRTGRSASAVKPNGSRPVRANDAKVTARRSVALRSQRGTNAVMVEEVLKSARPRAVRAAEIRKALQDSGVTVSFPSIHGALRQLEARDAAKQVGDSKTWRYHGGAA